MKKMTVALTVGIFAIAVFAFAADKTKPGSHGSHDHAIHELMLARQAWLGTMSKNLNAKKFDAVAKDADALAAQTEKVGETHPNPLGKEITLAISTLAKEISTAAAAHNGDTVNVKLGEIKARCDECHAKFRDK
jgi:cytochrome c556